MSAQNGLPDDIEMHCLTVRRRRARGLLLVGERLLCTVAGRANRLGWFGSGSNRERRGNQAETQFATRQPDAKRRRGAVRSMVGGTGRRQGSGREAEEAT